MAEMRKLDRSFYERDTLSVSRDLLGKLLVRESSEGRTVGTIVETEAYMGVEDRASHAYGGHRTSRNKVMWGPAGHAYVYLIYGMYWCLNLVTEREGVPRAALVRALEPVEGLDLMAQRRGFSELDSKKKKELTNGPGKLCMAMAVDKSLNGADLTDDILYLAEGEKKKIKVLSSTRINVDYAEEDASKPWRFMIDANPYVSRPRPF